MSLRTRLFLLFTAGAAVILLGAAAVLYVVLDRALLSETDEGLQARAKDLAAVMRESNGQIPDQDPFAQVLGTDGTVLDASPLATAATPIFDAATLAGIGGGSYLTRDVGALGGDSRFWLEPVHVGAAQYILVVGEPLDQYLHTRERLTPVLLIGGPLVVLSIAGAGWLLAGAALRPVQRMSDEADLISITDLDRRLELPPGNDEIAHLARTLNAMLGRIEESVAHERRFIDDASHELRTPLTILRGELELALAAPDDHAEMVEALRSALDEAERLSRLSNDLLELARARTTDGRGRAETIDLRDEVARVCSLLDRDGDPALVTTGPVALMTGDRDLVDQILINLVANAQRYARSRIEVSIVVDGDVERVALTVCDDGPGFPASMLPVTFERFRRGDAARTRDAGGTGLGLAIAADLVRAQGGTIVAGNDSPLGGACVEISFPRAARDDGREPGADVDAGAGSRSER
jgi:signal transduction histidine kinase